MSFDLIKLEIIFLINDGFLSMVCFCFTKLGAACAKGRRGVFFLSEWDIFRGVFRLPE